MAIFFFSIGHLQGFLGCFFGDFQIWLFFFFFFFFFVVVEGGGGGGGGCVYQNSWYFGGLL